ESLSQEKRPCHQPLFAELSGDEDAPLDLPPMPLEQQVRADYATAGLSLRAHPISFHRRQLDALGIVSAAQLARLAHGRFVRVAGIVLLRQRPSTAKGITFVTLEDETGTINLVVKQPIWQRYYELARTRPAWLAHGRLDRNDLLIHVVVL